MPIVLDGTNGITQAGEFNSDSSFGFKNRIINGAMVIDQRNNGALINPAVTGLTVDRWTYFQSQTSKGTIGQDAGAVTPPAGFTDYLGFTSTSAYSVGVSETFGIYQWIEGYNIADLNLGTANAKIFTVSFWVRSSLTGTFCASITNATDASYSASYTINAANTWEYKTITIPAVSIGTWNSTNGAGIAVYFDLGTGSSLQSAVNTWAAVSSRSFSGATSVVGTNGATFYVTGVQFEVGSTATSFDFRSIGTELQLCQRYTYRHSAEGNIDSYAPLGIGRYYGTNLAQLYVPFKVTMRTSPSSVTQIGNIFVNDTGLGGSAITLIFNETASSGASVTGTATTGTTAGNATTFYADNTSNAALIFSAEL
jgi:hypothetical protein